MRLTERHMIIINALPQGHSCRMYLDEQKVNGISANRWINCIKGCDSKTKLTFEADYRGGICPRCGSLGSPRRCACTVDYMVVDVTGWLSPVLRDTTLRDRLLSLKRGEVLDVTTWYGVFGANSIEWSSYKRISKHKYQLRYYTSSLTMPRCQGCGSDQYSGACCGEGAYTVVDEWGLAYNAT